jgi:type IV pilus assembly protein PilW
VNKLIYHRHQRGFSLIEIMIGLLIGMISVSIVLQVFSKSEASKRITSGGDDAQVNALLALHTLERDMRQAGAGISAFGILGCSLSYTSSSDGATISLSALGPITINPSAIPLGDSNTDTVLIISGNANSPSEGDPTTATSVSGAYEITTASNFVSGNYIIAAESTRPSTCSLILDKITAISSNTLTVSTGVAGLDSGSIVYDLGSSPSIKVYAIRNGNLTVCNYLLYDCGSTTYTKTLNSTVWVPVVSNVVSLRLQYAHDITNLSTSAMTGVVGQYDQCSPGDSCDPSSSVAVYCRWARIIGTRLAVVGRSTHYDKDKPTTSEPTWAGTTKNTSTSSTLTTLNPTALAIDLSSLNAWNYYRYKTLESSVPLRNIIWQGSQTTYQGGSGGC